MTVANNDVIRATAVLEGPAGHIENVYYYRVNPVIDSSDAAVMVDIAQHLDDAYDDLGSSLASTTVFIEVQGFNTTQGEPMPTVPWPSQTVGQGVGNTAAPQVSLGGFLRTGVTRIIKRVFIGGMVRDGFTADGEVNSTNVTNMGMFLGHFIGTFTGSTLNVYLPGVKSLASSAFWSFIEGIAQSNPYTQRRRRFGRGN